MKKQQTISMDIDAFLEHKATWKKVAQKNGWYSEPFYIHVWVDLQGQIVDSVAMREMTADVAIDADTDLLIGTFRVDSDKSINILP